MSVVWSEEDQIQALAVLEKIRKSLRNRTLPRKVYEAHLLTYKKISTEAVLMHRNGEIYLAQRPDKTKEPDEPYPGQWHTPGVTHLFDEYLDDTFRRLVERELGSYVWLEMPIEVGGFDYNDACRGMYELRVYLIRIGGLPKSDMRGRFFKAEIVESLDLVEAHRDIILPKALAKAKSLGWI